MKRIAVCLLALLCAQNIVALRYISIDKDRYRQTVTNSRTEIAAILKALTSQQLSANQKIVIIAQRLKDRPYKLGATGEGDWVPGSPTYLAGATHIIEKPLYRTDTFDCFTLVNTVLALLNSENLAQFDRNYVLANYGAAGIPATAIHYYNRNNFVSTDFNRLNEQNGLLKNITSQGVFAKYAKTVTATLDRARWFRYQAKARRGVAIIEVQGEVEKVRRKLQNYLQHLEGVQPQKIKFSYIPKQVLTRNLIEQIPTPAIIEIVRNPANWMVTVAGKKQRLSKAIGTDLVVSHLGVLYRQQYFCHANSCSVPMFLEATSRYPKSLYCYNRVTAQPLYAYLHDNRAVRDNPSILGIHIEQILQ